MWRHHHIVHLEPRIVGRCRLDLKDVKPILEATAEART